MVSKGIWYQEPWFRAVKYGGIEGPPIPAESKSVLVKKSVAVKIGKFYKNQYRYVIPIGGKNWYRYRYVIYSTESVSVMLKVSKSVRIGIG